MRFVGVRFHKSKPQASKLALSFLQRAWIWYAKAQVRRDGVWIPRPPVFEEGELETKLANQRANGT